jgi:hypothetical protein
MDYLEFIARVTSHIPNKGQVMIRYHGLYSNAHRGKIRKADSALYPPPIIEDEPPRREESISKSLCGCLVLVSRPQSIFNLIVGCHWLICFAFLVVDLVVFGVITLFQ